jgi:hypothetical protein
VREISELHRLSAHRLKEFLHAYQPSPTLAHLPARGTSIRGVAEETFGRLAEAEGREIFIRNVVDEQPPDCE